MKKQLFFDDKLLFGRDNLVRRYGKPEMVSAYSDGITSTDFGTGWVFPLADGKFRMLYYGHSKAYSGKKLFAAESFDGINFTPERFDEAANKTYPHEIMNIEPGWEIADVFEDKYCKNPEQRYKMLVAVHVFDEIRMSDKIFTSGDLLNWTIMEGVSWGNDTEPMACVFYNKHKKVYTIIERPFWGVRCAGYKETADWENFTEYRYCVNVDSLDEKLSEIYGMFAFEYDGMYIGLPHLYRGLKSEFNAKYKNGIIDTELAYSYDGRYWQRSIREPFISGMGCDEPYYLTWITSMRKGGDGKVYFYGSVSEQEHGPAFHNPQNAKIVTYSMREDGFISLVTEKPKETSSIITREKLWEGGELHLNLKAKRATVGVFVTDDSELVEGNLLGFARPIEGYTHEDCIPLSGDLTDWVPKFKDGRKIDELSGKTLVFELRLEEGEVFSLSGDYIDLFNTQAARYRYLNVLP